MLKEEFESDEVELVGLGEGKRFAYKAGESLSQGVVPAFYMCGQPGLFTNRLMVPCETAEDLVIGGPEVAEGRAVSIGGRNPLPQAPATGRAAIADEVGYDLSRATTEGNPDPPNVFFEPTKDHSSVSYTHLDVYKRQAERGRASRHGEHLAPRRIVPSTMNPEVGRTLCSRG